LEKFHYLNNKTLLKGGFSFNFQYRQKNFASRRPHSGRILYCEEAIDRFRRQPAKVSMIRRGVFSVLTADHGGKNEKV
jgi:hypothetical protein